MRFFFFCLTGSAHVADTWAACGKWERVYVAHIWSKPVDEFSRGGCVRDRGSRHITETEQHIYGESVGSGDGDHLRRLLTAARFCRSIVQVRA